MGNYAEWELETEADDCQRHHQDDVSIPDSTRTLTRLYRATQVLRRSVDVDPQKRGGVPVLAGTRFKAAQLLAQIADGDSIDDLEDDLGLMRQQLGEEAVFQSVIPDLATYNSAVNRGRHVIAHAKNSRAADYVRRFAAEMLQPSASQKTGADDG